MSGLKRPSGLAVDGAKGLLWTDLEDRAVWRAQLDGSQAEVHVEGAWGLELGFGVFVFLEVLGFGWVWLGFGFSMVFRSFFYSNHSLCYCF